MTGFHVVRMPSDCTVAETLRGPSTVQASHHYQHSLDIYATLEYSPGMARAQNNLANLYFDQDDWERATEYYQQALATLERIGDLYGQAVIANNADVSRTRSSTRTVTRFSLIRCHPRPLWSVPLTLPFYSPPSPRQRVSLSTIRQAQLARFRQRGRITRCCQP